METVDDNENQGSSPTTAEIPADDVVNTNSQCNVNDDNQAADYTVVMETDDQDSLLPLNLICPRSGSLSPELHNQVEEDGNDDQSSQCEQDENNMENTQNNDEILSEEGEEEVDDDDTGGDFMNNDDALIMAENGDGKDDESIDNMQENEDQFSGKEEEPSQEDDNDFKEVDLVNSNEDEVLNEDRDNTRNLPEDTELCSDNDEDKEIDDTENMVALEEDFHERDIADNESIEELEKESHHERDISANDKIVQLEEECFERNVQDISDENNQDIADELLNPDKCDTVDRSANSTPQFTAILNSEDSYSSVPIPESADNCQSQNSLSSQEQDRPPSTEMCNDVECCIQLDAETYKEWSATKKTMRFETDVQMAKFLLKRLAVHGFADSEELSQVTSLESSFSKTSEAQKKKSVTTTTGGIESIVRRLHQVRTETPPPRSPQTDCESNDNIGGDADSNESDFITVKFDEEGMCNTENVESSKSIPKRAYTSIYSSGRTGRKRVFVKREPGTDVSGNEDQHSSNNYGFNSNEQQSEHSGNEQPWPVQIKQEPMDEVEEKINQADKEDELLSSTPGSLGHFVRNAASWVSNLVASELEKPPKTSTPANYVVEDPQNLFSESRLHKIIEQQLSKTPEPSEPENKLLHTMIGEQLAMPSQGSGIPTIKTEPEDDYEKQPADSKVARKEQKRARKEARQAKKLKKALKRERTETEQNYRDPKQPYTCNSPFENSSSERSSPYEKSSSPFDKTSSPASHCLESFARMVQIREFQGGGSQASTEVRNPSISGMMNRSLPVPTDVGMPRSATTSPHIPATSQKLMAPYSPKSLSPAPKDNPVQQATPSEHPASLALKSFAQRTVVPAQPVKEGNLNSLYMQTDALSGGDVISKGTPLEQLLKVSENPQHQNSAKSQLEHLLKSKNIKSKWATPSPSHNTYQTEPYNLTQANMEAKYSSPHILKVPKVTFSGRTSYGVDQDQFVKAPVIDRILASTGLSSDSEDSDYKEAKSQCTDPDWSPVGKRPATRRSRKRSLPKNVYANSVIEAVQPATGTVVAADKENGEPSIGNQPDAKHPRLGQDVPSTNTLPADNGGVHNTDLSATNTLAKLLQMKNQQTNAPMIHLLSPNRTKPSACDDAQGLPGESPKRDFTAKQSAVGVMQAFAQLVEIQGISQNGNQSLKDQSVTNHIESNPLLSRNLPYLTSDGKSNTLSQSLPLLTPDGEYHHNSDNCKQSADVRNVIDQNGARHKGRTNGNNVDEPEDLTVYSKIKIKEEPNDGTEQQESRISASINHHRVTTNGASSPVKYTCSLCSKIFHSKTEVKEHKMIVHYSSGSEMVS